MTNHAAARPNLAKAKKIIARKATLGSLFRIFFLDYQFIRERPDVQQEKRRKKRLQNPFAPVLFLAPWPAAESLIWLAEASPTAKCLIRLSSRYTPDAYLSVKPWHLNMVQVKSVKGYSIKDLGL